MQGNSSKTGLLNSWKEVASYLGRGVRTVQRWEKNGLPVRRLGNGSRAPIVASVRDVDAWMQSAHMHGFANQQSQEQLLFRGSLSESIEHSRRLREEMVSLRNGQRMNMTALMNSLAELYKSCGVVLPPPRVNTNSERRNGSRNVA